MSALAATDDASENGRAPKDDLYRVLPAAVEVRADDETDEDPDEGRILYGHFAVTNRWTEINSMWEGRFMERFATGAFKKTLRENRDGLRILFQHGMDPQVGDKPIAAVRDLREDDEGAYYEARLLDGVPELIVSGLREGVYGASFRFSSMREEWAEEPGASEHNPEGLPERTIKEARVAEGGPVTFPAYADATAQLRSATDHFLILRSADPEARRLLLDRMNKLPDLGTRTSRAAEAGHTEEIAPEATDAAREGTSDVTRREPNAATGGTKPAPLFTGSKNRGANQSWRL